MSTQEEPEPKAHLWIDWKALTSDTLQGVLEDLVTRNEPDETPLETRCRQLELALKKDAVRLYFDLAEETVFLLPTAGQNTAGATETSLPG